MLRPDDISAVFEWVELLLIKSLKRNLSRHKQEEQDEGFNWTAWQAEKLRNVDTFRRQSKAIMDRYTDIIDSETRELLEEQFAEGVNGADVPPAESVPDTPAEVTPEPHFFGVDKTKVNKLIEDVSYLEKNAETAALRLTDDVYRQTVNRVQLAMSTGSISYGQAVDMAVADFLTQGINCIEYKDGRRVNIADYVRMVLRTTSTRAALQGKSAKFKAQGYDTVLVSSYGMCSKTCLPWQGRAYIEDTFSYWDGEVEERNGILYGKSNYCGKWFPLLSSAIEKGLFHPNCRHSINLYIEGVTDLPEPMDNSDIERRYKLEQRQRALEREVRKAKRKVEGSLAPEDIKKAKAELREAQKNVRDFIAQTNAEEGARVLARNPLQEKIYSGDIRIGSSAEPVHAPESLPANVSDGHSVEVDIPAPDNGKPDYTDTPIPKNVHNSSVTDKVTAKKASAVELWEAENYKNSTEKGLLILPDGTTKDFGGIEHHVTGKEEDIKLMDGATFTHNHPTDNTFSQNDIVTGLVKGNLKEMRAATSTGDVHILVNNGATEQQRKKFNVDYQQRRMKAANTADAKIRRGEKINKDEYVKERLETFMNEHAEEYNLSYTKHRINVSPKNIVVQGGFDESKIISDDIKAEISRCIEKVQGEYNVKVDIFSFEEIKGMKVPFQFVPVDDNGKYKSKFVINKGFNWEENLDKLNERIYNKNYSKGILASQNTEDLIYHEMAHFMTFQECDDFYDYVSLERSVRRDFKAGVSMYSDVTEDGAETIAEAFVRIKNNEAVSDDVKELVRIYVERWRK